MNGPTVIKLRPSTEDVLKTFFSEILQASPGVRPVFFVGLADDGHVVLHTMPVTFRDLAWVKTSLDMHFVEEWLL